MHRATYKGKFMTGYITLASAIVIELFSTSMLKASAGFTKPFPTIIFLIGMASSFYLLSQTLHYLPLSLVYAIWSGVGTALTAVISVVIWKEEINMQMIFGILFIIGGVVLLNFRNNFNT